ncbi:MAG TPA: NAD(P)-binding domain-containing protein [Geminicoccaceae bacterium]|jgi:4-hydroxybutyrate dehydrogenase/sulfolactaldehyde 3-reductase|nr:NAD(P)-binding domain-containing protein [Geminicoccaceae bacterium]
MATIGFVGLGHMGGAMSRNLMRAGHQLEVFDIAEDAVAALVADGARGAASPAAVAKGKEIVFTMLPIGKIVEEAVFGPNGIAETIAEGSVVVDMSTILPTETKRIGERLKAQGVGMVDAPVGRTSAHAVTGTSTFMVGGEPADIERVRPLLMAMGEMVTICGPLGTGAAMKLVNNYISAVVNLATAEGLAMGLKAGLELPVMAEVLSHTPAGRGHITTTWPEKALKDEPSPAFMLDLASKDLSLALDMAAALQVTLATGAVGKQLYASAQANGHGRSDWTTGMFRTLKKMGGVASR